MPPPTTSRESEPAMPVTVLVVDDHPMILEGVTSLLATEEDLKVVGSCADGGEAIRVLEQLKPDLLVLDLHMEPVGGWEVLRRLPGLSRRTKPILLTASLTQAEMLEAVELGVEGILLKGDAAEDLVACIRKVLEGERVIDPRFMAGALEAAVLERQQKREVERTAGSLTARETEVSCMVAKALSNKGIARELGITEGTVKLHLHKIFQKLGVSNRVELTLFVKENLPAG
jgi:DNA-binding NarL/FixJ family response regulator